MFLPALFCRLLPGKQRRGLNRFLTKTHKPEKSYWAIAATSDFLNELTLRPKQKAQALDLLESLEIMRGRMHLYLS